MRQQSVVQPIAWRGVVLTGSASGTLLALAPGDGRTLWSIQLEGQLRGLGAHGTGLLVGSIEGTLFALSEEPAG